MTISLASQRALLMASRQLIGHPDAPPVVHGCPKSPAPGAAASCVEAIPVRSRVLCEIIGTVASELFVARA
jgi:hypothetical protein